MVDKGLRVFYLAYMVSSSEFHRDFLEFRVLTTEIPVSGLLISRAIEASAMTALLHEPKNKMFSWKAEISTPVQFFLKRENDFSFMLRTLAQLSLSCTCVRCLDPAFYKSTLDFSIRMLEKEHLEGINVEDDWQFDSTEVDSREDEQSVVGYFSDKCIDLGIILRDQIFLDMPDYPQCGPMNRDTRASCNKVLPLEDGQIRDNPFVKLLAKKK